MSRIYSMKDLDYVPPKIDPSIPHALDGNLAVANYKETAVYMLGLVFPQLTVTELEYAVDRAIEENIQYHPAVIDNSYKKTKVEITLPELAHYILSKKPIITTYGVMFSQHTEHPNPLYKMIDSFIINRDVVKKKMFQYPKGSFDFEKYSLLQLLYKLDANAFYGANGMYTCFYYNFYVASAVTAQGRSLNATMALFFEQFLANNVPFGSLNEVIEFIHNIINDPVKMDDNQILDHHANLQETFFKVMSSTGFNYVPSEKDMEIVWTILSQLSQTELNRIYYKNNLYEFCSNTKVMNLVIQMLTKLDKEWGDSNAIPEEIHDEVELFTDLLREYVYYGHQIIDRLEKMDCLIRSVSIIQDTDSAIVSYDAWYRFILQHTAGIDMKIKNTVYDPVSDTTKPNTFTLRDYDFENDEIVEIQRMINPIVTIPQDQLRHSILSIMAHPIHRLLNEYMYAYTQNSQAFLPKNDEYPLPKGFQCHIFAKTEFLFRRLLLTDAKKHYASDQETQEGNYIPPNKALDTKGMDAFNKSTTNDAIKEKLKKLLYEEILHTPVIDQARVVKGIAIIEREIFQSIQDGKKEFYKPAKVKSQSAYVNPLGIQGIKASLAYNALHEPGTEELDMTVRNSIDIAKVDINPKNIERIRSTHPGVYERAIQFMNTHDTFSSGIDCIGIPINEPVPDWILPFIRYDEIINDNVGNFPLESIGLKRGGNYVNKSNIVQF